MKRMTQADRLREDLLSLLNEHGIERRIPHENFMKLVDFIMALVIAELPELEAKRAL